MNLLLPGMYMSADTVLHRLDPRVKTAGALLLMTVPFVAQSLGSYLLLTAFVAATAFLANAPLLALTRTLGTVFWIGFFMFFFYLFTTPGQTLIGLGPLVVSWEGLTAGATQIYRICLLVIIASLLTFTTSPAQLAHGLEAAFGPLARAGLPVRELVMVLTIALSFVPTLFDEIEKISKAQRARGADFQSGGLSHRFRSLVPVFIPVFVSAFRRAEDLAIAMEARGFRGTARRTRLHRLRLGRHDLLASLAVLAVFLAALGLDRLAQSV